MRIGARAVGPAHVPLVVAEIGINHGGSLDVAREMVDALLADRRARGLPIPTVDDRDIDTDAGWQRAFFDKVPVVELGDARLDTVTSLARLRRLLADQLDSGRP